MVRRVGAWDSHVEGLKWTLIAALGVAACSGRSVRHESEDDAGDSGTGATGGSRGGGKATGGGGGSAAKGGSGFGARGGVGGSGGVGASGGFGTDGGVGAAGAVGGGAVSGMGGTAGIGGTGFQPEGCAAAAGHAQNVELCRGGFVHRVGMAECSMPPRIDAGAGANHEGGASQGGASGGDPAPGAGGQGEEGDCLDDLDCTAAPHGFCVYGEHFETGYSFCVFACKSDQDCAASELCSCGESFSHRGTEGTVELGLCVSATCRSDSECGSGLLCSSPVDFTCGTPQPTGYRCQQWADQCAGPGDCSEDEECVHEGDRFTCAGRLICGRPFIVGDGARLADSLKRSDWSGALAALASEGLDDASRAAIARHWRDSALAEHASVAAFARFTLELMTLGAPRELVEASVCAMRDETRHATLCFGLASRYAESAIGPSALDLSGAFADSDFLAVVDRAVVEGVIGETAAALEAAWARDAATDEDVRAALATIAEDESRHAALAFRFLAWAAERDERVLPLVEQRLAEAERGLKDAERLAPARLEAEAGTAILRAHGVLDTAIRREARAATLRDIVPDAMATLRHRLPEANPSSLGRDPEAGLRLGVW